METAVMLKALQDPLGIPFYPLVFQALMVLTFALHILFVNFTLGTSLLAVYGYLKGGDNWERLSRPMAKATTVNVSLAMLLGVAPLLFVQVIYDPFWYASNTLSAAWVIGFILIMMAAYSLTYVFFLRRDSGAKTGLAAAGILAFALFLAAGIIMHVLGYQLLLPEKWLGWYVKGTAVNTAGTSLHAFQLPRWLHFMVPTFAMTGVFMMLYAWYFLPRQDKDRQHLQWVGRAGAKMAFYFTALQAVVGVWWLLSLPAEFNFLYHPLFLAAAALGLAFLVLLFLAQKDPIKYALPSALGGVLTILAMSATREALRMKYLGRFAYSIYEHKINLDWGSTALFLGTFVMGLFILGYMLTVAFKSGRATGEYAATKLLNQWGRVSIALLIIWIVLVAGLGVVITIKNYF